MIVPPCQPIEFEMRQIDIAAATERQIEISAHEPGLREVRDSELTANDRRA